MEPIDAIEKLEESEIFKSWRARNRHSYLANCFMMIQVEGVFEWQIGYYNKHADKITTFFVGDDIHKNPESEVFKEGKIVLPLSLDKVKVKFSTAMDIARRIQKEKYPSDTLLKKIILLQNTDVGTIYNLTFITMTFKTLNIKISTETGQIISEKLTSIMDFKAAQY